MSNREDGVIMDFEEKYIIETDEKLGRCLIAQTNLYQGDFIFKDSPIVSGPSRDSNLVCFNCYECLDDEDVSACERCGLPLCESCTKNDPGIHTPECEALSHSGRQVSLRLLDDVPLLFEVVIVLRCYFLRNSPDVWSFFLSLMSHSQDRRETEMEDRALKVAEFIINNINAEIPENDILSICGILDTNSFEIPLPSSSGTIQAIYSIGCLPEHNCIPSGHRCFDMDLSLVLRAAVDIEVGQHISITYTDSLSPTLDRRNYLSYSKHFNCICDRCRDPTENESFIGALKCLRCGVGRVLPNNPLEDIRSLSWSCMDCNSSVPNEWVDDINDKASKAIQAMEESDLHPERCHKLLELYSRVLHPQHAHMLDIKHTLLHLLGHTEGYLLDDLTNDHLRLKEEIARCLLNVAEKVLPGISRLRGTTLYELFLTYQQRAINWAKADKARKDTLATFETARNILQQSIYCLQYEPIHQPEGKLVERAKEDMNILSKYIQDFRNEKR